MVFGATGMVGQAVLLECLDDPDITRVLAVGRTPVTQQHPKLVQVTQPDMFDLSPVTDRLAGYEACFFCLGVSSAGMKEPEYRHLTYDLTESVAKTLAQLSPEMAFLYVSGESTDSTEHGRVMWARVKGATENVVMHLPFHGYAIRPGFIQPRRGVRSRTRWYAALYTATGWMFPALRRLAPRLVITSDELGRAMITIAKQRPRQRIWRTKDLVARGRVPR
jgi:uncharacterized protein YbjT (DUF2867 family)